MTSIFLGLGSNLPSRRKNLRMGLAALAPHLQNIRVSSIYETAPMDYIDQPAFLNAVVVGETRLQPRHWLRIIQDAEIHCGRKRAGVPEKGPRTLDVDILFFGNRQVESADLTIPHPALIHRQFVLVPLLELEPQMRHPVSGLSLQRYSDSLMDQDVKKSPISWVEK